MLFERMRKIETFYKIFCVKQVLFSRIFRENLVFSHFLVQHVEFVVVLGGLVGSIQKIFLKALNNPTPSHEPDATQGQFSIEV